MSGDISMLLSRVLAVVLMVAGFSLKPPGEVAQAQEWATDRSGVQVSENPLLAELSRRDPVALRGVLTELADIEAGRSEPVAHYGNTSPTPFELRQLQANPALLKAYGVRPDPMLELLRRMNDALKGTAR